MKVSIVDATDVARIDAGNRATARRLADLVARGEPLTAIDRSVAAALIAWWADRPAIKPKRARGQPARFADGAAALEVAVARLSGVQRADAIGAVADRLGVTDQAVADAVNKNVAEVEALFGKMPATQRKTSRRATSKGRK